MPDGILENVTQKNNLYLLKILNQQRQIAASTESPTLRTESLS